MDGAKMLAELPWRYPFLMVDRLVEWAAHGRIVTRKNVTAGDPLTLAGSASLPALLLLEGLGQSAALLFRLSYPEDQVERRLPMLGFLSARLHGTASVGETVEFEVRAVKMTRQAGLFEGRARRGDVLLAEAELAFGAGELST